MRTWPQEDQEELTERAREIQVKRSGVYLLSDDECEAIEEVGRGVASAACHPTS